MQNKIAIQTIREVYGQLVSISLPCHDVSIRDFLAPAHGKPRFYWRHNDITLAGIGTALEIKSMSPHQVDNIRAQVTTLFENAAVHADNSLATPRLFGGFSFFQDFVSDYIWSIYFPAHFVLPHYQFLRIGAEQWLTINVQISYEENPQEILADLKAALEEKIEQLHSERRFSLPESGSLIDTTYPMPFETWRHNIQTIINAIRAGEVEKVVMARAAEMRFDNPVNVLTALEYLGAEYPECYRFLFEPRPGYAFLGATPELLVHVQGDTFHTMGLAGSIRRGSTPAEDAQFADALLNSTKDQHEHQVVVDTIVNSLKAHTRRLDVGNRGILTLSNIQHIHTPITGTLNPDEDVLSLLQILHPTPAMGGKPRTQALQIIHDLEPVPRGWYAAPIGWLDGNLNGEFGVAIRSAVVQDKRAWLYAGAGIVTGSDPQKEWDETALKFRPMLNALANHP